MSNQTQCQIVKDATRELVRWAKRVRAEANTPFEAAQQVVTRLGAHYRDGYAEIGFWTPELIDQNVPVDRALLEVLTPLEEIDFRADQQEICFRRERLCLEQDEEYLWGVVDGMRPGSRDCVGAFYWVTYQDDKGAWHNITDYLAYSVPFGAFAPAEFYDMERLQKERPDRAHFSQLDVAPDPDGVPRVQAPLNILQIHVGTASAEGTLAGLTRIYNTIARKIRAGEPLTPAEENYVGYDAIQLMPIAPTIEYEAGPRFWQQTGDDATSDTITVTLRRPDMTNWGYDILLSAMSAVNPVVLGSSRPDEMVEFIAALHNFPNKPIKAMFDIVYGHIDNQALPLLNRHFFAGANMYGQNVNLLHPLVRALLIEMQRRKHNYGVDGIRVDGAQDFKNWDAETDTMWHDDDYLRLMNDVVQEVAGQCYRPWMIFEDGRPWPRDDWELASTYRVVTEQMPNVWQWGPLTFAHNTPFLFTFWISKWWRIREMAEVGSHWITGCANHDTLRRGTQVDVKARINTYLGDSLFEIFQKAYDNPAAKLFDYAFMPGIPMDFINASMRGPWGFIRNTDDRYSVKVVSEEARFLHWAMDEARFAMEETFSRLKTLGFTDLEELRRFMHTLDHVVQATEYDLNAIVLLLQNATPPLAGGPFSISRLKTIARAWMDDVHEYCNVSHYADELDPERTRFNLTVREFRRARPWLMNDLRPDEHLAYQHPTNGTVLFYGLRRAPHDSEQILFVANMEGAPRSVIPLNLSLPDLPRDGWRLALATPDLDAVRVEQEVELHDSQGVVFTRH